MSTWNYHGDAVYVPRSAEIPKEYRQHGQHASLVQHVIDHVSLRASDKEAWATVEVDEDLRESVVPVKRRPRVWGVHAGHTAANPQASPFVRQGDSFTNHLTVHLAQRDGHIMLVRVYPGEYRPPLPWQQSARGVLDACLKYWRTHAYVHNPRLVMRDTRTTVAPDWL